MNVLAYKNAYCTMASQSTTIFISLIFVTISFYEKEWDLLLVYAQEKH